MILDDETERVSGRIEKDPPLFIRLNLACELRAPDLALSSEILRRSRGALAGDDRHSPHRRLIVGRH